MSLDGLHVDRGRAALFGSIAQMYDRFRPTYPDALIDDLAALHPSEVLDVGCGTGKAAAALVRRGLRVLGVEPDERMAAVARSHGVPVDVASFEAWNAGGRTFDLITSAQAWHWIDPAVGIPKVAQLLTPGGTIALFWNYHVLDEPVISAFDAVYSRHAPELEGLGHDPSGTPDVDPFAGNDAFTSVESRTYRWERTLNAEDWIGLVATFSDHQRLGAQRLNALQQALHERIRGFGGVVQSHCGTYVWLARGAPAGR